MPMQDGPARLLGWLGGHPGAWTTTELAVALGVTDRSVRNYVAQLNSGPEPLVERTSKGYRLTSAATPAAPQRTAGADQVTQRGHDLLRRLLTSTDPVGVFDLAADLAVSDSTIDNDVRRLAQAAALLGVGIRRSGDMVTVEGAERDRRRLMRQSITEVADAASILSTDTLQGAYDSYDIRDIKRNVARALAAHGLHSNAYSLNPLVLDLVIALDRITDDHPLNDPTANPTLEDDPRLAGATRDITSYLRHAYGVEFDRAEFDAVALLIASKTTLLRGATDSDVVIDHVGQDLAGMVREILTDLGDTYLVDLVDDPFVTSLALHTHNLLLRARAGRPQANPLAGAIRSGHPLVHELAVYFARQLERRTGVAVHPDEVGFLAFHLGAALDQRRASPEQVSLSLVAPGYHDLTARLARRLQDSLGERAVITQTIESGEADAADLVGELVITPVAIPGVHPARQVLISPLLNTADLDLIDGRVRAQQRRNTWMRLLAQLHELFHEGLFHRSPAVTARDDVLALLAGAMRTHAAVPDDFLEQVIERENLSSTAFNDIVAIPHSLGMTAQRTSIAVAVFDHPIDWAGTPVKLVLLVAFSSTDRNLFRDTFDQLVISLTEPRNVQRLIDHGHTLPDFLAELGRLMQDE
jgi:lichenan operon transcriptional antiterminator